jgi:tetratricopeptide (TPR) repeat protein
MMQRLQNTRRLVALAFVAATAVAPALTAPASAQTPPGQSSAGTAFKVLVHSLDNKNDPKNTRFGEKVADLVRKGIAPMATHTPVAEKDVQAALKKLNVLPQNYDCTTARQLALRAEMKAQVVMCGEYESNPAGGYKVTANFYTTEEAISFDVLPFDAASETDAANTIVTQFKSYVRQLQLASYCQQNVQAELWQDALDKCNEALQMNPRSRTSLYFRATALLKLNKPEEALAGYQKVLEINPIDTDAMRSAGSVAAQLGKSDVAMKYFRDYLQLNPGDEQVMLTIANDLNKGGDAVAAAKFLEEQLKGDTTNYALQGVIGNYWMVAASGNAKSTATDAQKAEAKGQFASALTYYTRILNNLPAAKVEPKSLDDLYRYMMQAYTLSGQPEKAAALTAAAFANDSSTAATFIVGADALNRSGKSAEAIAALEKAAIKDPTQKVSYQKAALALVSGNLDDIVKYAKAAAAEGASDDQMDALAMQLVSEGQKKSGSERGAWFDAARSIAKGDKPGAMANYFEGSNLYQQAAALIPKAPKVISKSDARTALSLLQRARPLIANSTAFTEAAAQRATSLSGIDQTAKYLSDVIKQAQ